MYDISKEFECLLSLVSDMGVKKKDIEVCAAELLHALNESIRECLECKK